MTTVGVIGHTGFIGQAVARAVTRRNLTLRLVDLPRIEVPVHEDPTDGAEAWRRKGAGWDRLVEQLRGVDVIVNAAGAPDSDGSDYRSMWSSNVLLPVIVAAACAEAGVNRLVHISSAAVQGPGPLDDTTRVAAFSAYSRSKADAERQLASRNGSGPPTIVIYRPTSVMGPDRARTQRLRRRCAGWVPVVSADTPLPLAHIDNVGDAGVFLATLDDPPFVATHPSENVTVGDLVSWSGGSAHRIPNLAKATGLTMLKAAAVVRPTLRGPAARVELFLSGQELHSSALLDRGWVPPVPKEHYAWMFSATSASGPLRIAFLITRSDTLGGAHIHVRDLARSLLDLGHDVHVLIGADGPYGDILRSLEIPVVSVPSLVREFDVPADRRAYRELKAILLDLDPEILSTHSSKAGVLGRMAGKRLGIPTLFTAHGWAFTPGVGRKRQLAYSVVEMAAAPLASRIVCVSENDRRLARRMGIDRLATTTWIPNAVRDVAAELRCHPETEPPRLIMVARLDGQKCQHEVLEALARLADRPFSIDFVGDGPRLQELQDRAGELGIADRCRFLGRRDDVEAVLADAQVFVLMTNYEGMPRSILEAMRAGLPVVASRTGGVPEVVVDGETGFLVEPHDVDGLVATLSRLLDDPSLRASIGGAGRRRFESRYELGRLVTDMLGVYSEVVGRPLPRHTG